MGLRILSKAVIGFADCSTVPLIDSVAGDQALSRQSSSRALSRELMCTQMTCVMCSQVTCGFALVNTSACCIKTTLQHEWFENRGGSLVNGVQLPPEDMDLSVGSCGTVV